MPIQPALLLSALTIAMTAILLFVVPHRADVHSGGAPVGVTEKAPAR